MQFWRHIMLSIACALLLAACGSPRNSQTGGAQAAELAGVAPQAIPSATVDTSTLAATATAVSITSPTVPDQSTASCPVTLPLNPPFTPPLPYPPEAPYGDRFWYGTEALWTTLPADGRWDQLALGEKVFWWREGYNGAVEPQPQLMVIARRLDAQAPNVEIGPPATNAYHSDFHWAMLIGVELPTIGCWELTGHYDDHELSFVVWVGP
jgi:hypothetical protein